MKNNPSIGIAIMTKNEAENISACIESVLWADEVLILDCGSTDDTVKICKKHPVTVINTDWPGFDKQCNRALETLKSDWQMIVDADERITPKLKEEIITVIGNKPKHYAYKIPRLNFFMGKAMKHCLNPKGDTPTRLFLKNSTCFRHSVHQEAVVDGSIGKLKNYLLHYPYKNLAALLAKTNYYSSLTAEKSKHTSSGVFKTISHAICAFTRVYILKLGFLDGWPGFIIAFSNFEGAFYKYAKLAEKHKKDY